MSKDHSSAKPAEPETHKHHEDDVIVVPKGSNRSRFLLTALLAVLVLTTFTVSGEVVDVLTGRNRAASAYMSWKRPDGTVEKISQSDFFLLKQAMTKTMGLLSGGRSQNDHDDAATAQHILADHLAQEAGVAVTNEEVAKIILQVFGTADTYKRRLADYRMSAKDFEETLRSMMRVRRYEMLVTQGFAQPDPQAIEKAWKEGHQQYSVDTVELTTDTFTADAQGACPTGPDLQAYYDGLSEPEKNTYRRPVEARTSAEFVWFQIDPSLTKTEKLLEKYPRPPTENADEVAKTWYETNKDLLYVKAGLPPGKPREPGDYKPFEEVAEHAKTAGIAYQSMLDWYNDMLVRDATAEKASLYAEGTAMGLAYRLESTLHTMAEWNAASMAFQGKAPILATFEPTAEPQKLLPEVFVDAKGLFIGRQIGKEAGHTPEFAEFQDKVRDTWIKKKKSELAKAKLDLLLEKIPTEPDPLVPDATIHVEVDGEKFKAAATELGLEVKTQDWFDVSQAPPPGENTPFRMFARRSAARHGKTVGTVTAPELSPDQSAAWLARIAGKRDPDPATMTPLDYDSARSMATYEARNDFMKSTFLSDDFLKEQYALDLEIWRRQAEEAGKTGTPK